MRITNNSLNGPMLLTEAEAIQYLRLDTIEWNTRKRGSACSCLQHLIDKRLLKPTRISNVKFYAVKELNALIEKLTDGN